MEAEPLSLSPKQFPLQVTLHARVVERFADEPVSAEQGATLDRDLLTQRLRQWQDLDDCPLDTILAQGQLQGDTRPPTQEQAALLRWVGAAYNLWEQEFPLDEDITRRLRRLKPLSAILALEGGDFLVPGRHSLHQLLDNIQAASIGWQASLGRAGQALLQQLDEAIEQALGALDQPGTDIAAITAALEKQLARDGERAQKLAGRVVEMELGREKKIEAAGIAASMINSALEKYRAPADVGKLIKGPWYDSAQLLVLKFGAESEQWQKMSKATETLLDSVQVHENEPEDRRQRLFRVVTLLPRELRRWLLSLQHDSSAVDDAVAVVEFAHLCILRQKPLECETIEPLPLTRGFEPNGEEPAADGELGQWYLIEREGEPPLRARIIFRLQQERQMLFANRAGMEILRLGCEEFSALLDSGKATLLQRGASYSRCLAAAAGIEQESDLENLDEAGAPGQTSQPAVEESPMTEEEVEQDRLWQEWQEARARQQGLNQAESKQPDNHKNG